MKTKKEAIMLARKYNLERVIRQEIESGLTPDEALSLYEIV